MKGRLSSTIWFLIFWVGLAFVAVLGLAYHAGKDSGGLSLLEFGSLPSASSGALLGAAALAFFGVLAVVYVLNKRVLKPADELAKFSERVVAGDVRARAEIESQDEFGFIAENFNRSVAKVAHAVTNQQAQDSLQRSITDLLNTINQVARGDLTIRGRVTNDALGNVVDSVNFMLDNFTKVLERVRKAAIDVSTSANQILEAADEMTAGAVQQDQEITNTSSAVEELTVSMKQVSNNAEASAEAARRALDAAEQGNRAVRDTLDGMQRIRSSVQATAKKIKSLGDRSLEISEIINVINDITEQTNLLALNAAIEAARAGEAGRGFAVVADEVRKLAEKSTQSTKEIADLIQSIQREARQAVENMERSTRIVEEGLTLGNDLGSALHKISNVVTEVYKFSQEIGAATNEQSVGSAQIAKATGRLTEITQEINSAVEEQASGAQAVVRAMDKMRELVQQSASSSTELSAAAEQMLKLSRNLLDSMDRFVLDRASQPQRARRDSFGKRRGQESQQEQELEYAELARS